MDELDLKLESLSKVCREIGSFKDDLGGQVRLTS